MAIRSCACSTLAWRGSIVCLPEGVYAWDVASPDELDMAAMTQLLGALEPGSFVLLGTGTRQVFPAPELRRAFMDAAIGLEPMDTGAACRTYNVLLAERRPVAPAG